jgi:hypothetical protein
MVMAGGIGEKRRGYGGLEMDEDVGQQKAGQVDSFPI